MAEVFDLENIKKKMIRKYPYFGSTITGINYEIVDGSHPVQTMATDGKAIYANAKYLSSISEDEQLFSFSHEVCHIALKHISRSKGKDPKLWNIATDAVINQHLKNDGFKIPEGCVDIADALYCDAEELYEKLLKEKKQQQQLKEQQNGQQQGQDGQQQNSRQPGQGQNTQKSNQQGKPGQSADSSPDDTQNEKSPGGQGQSDGYVDGSDHSMWQDAVKREEQENLDDKEKGEQAQDEAKESLDISERQAFKKNAEERIKRAEEVMRRIQGLRRGVSGESQEVYIDNIGKADASVTNWKKLLVRSLEMEDEAWGHRFSDRSNNYEARLEDVEYDEKAETEIILDTSGSVSVDLLKMFLRQVKTVLKNSTIKVGTFSTDFHGFVEIKRESDIDSLKLKVGGGTNFNAASEAFTKRKDVNKICFTDGCDGGDAHISVKRKDIVWISFENPNFKPDNGRVLFVPKKQIIISLKEENQPDEPEM